MTIHSRSLILAAGLTVALAFAAVVTASRRSVPEPQVPSELAAAVARSLQFDLPSPPPPLPPPPEVLDAPILSLPLPEQRAFWHREIVEDRRVLDACIYLVDIGDESSVPFLIEGLRRNPISPNGSMIDTRWACLAALEHITGHKLGRTTRAWERWWSKRQAAKRGPA